MTPVTGRLNLSCPPLLSLSLSPAQLGSVQHLRKRSLLKGATVFSPQNLLTALPRTNIGKSPHFAVHSLSSCSEFVTAKSGSITSGPRIRAAVINSPPGGTGRPPGQGFSALFLAPLAVGQTADFRLFCGWKVNSCHRGYRLLNRASSYS